MGKDISVLNFLGVDRINKAPEVGGGFELLRHVAGLQTSSSISVSGTFAGLGVPVLDAAASEDLKHPWGVGRETSVAVLISVVPAVQTSRGRAPGAPTEPGSAGFPVACVTPSWPPLSRSQ